MPSLVSEECLTALRSWARVTRPFALVLILDACELSPGEACRSALDALWLSEPVDLRVATPRFFLPDEPPSLGVAVETADFWAWKAVVSWPGTS